MKETSRRHLWVFKQSKQSNHEATAGSRKHFFRGSRLAVSVTCLQTRVNLLRRACQAVYWSCPSSRGFCCILTEPLAKPTANMSSLVHVLCRVYAVLQSLKLHRLTRTTARQLQQ